MTNLDGQNFGLLFLHCYCHTYEVKWKQKKKKKDEEEQGIKSQKGINPKETLRDKW